MTGLAVEIVYDDNSTELAEPAKITLKTSNPLTKLTRFVVVTYGGKELRVAVTVTENEAEEDTPADSSDSSSEVVEDEKKGCGSALTSGFAGALAIVAVGVLTAKGKKERADE
jgi:hypothetical protein